jgi:iron complex outermembrane receptor protein
MAHAYQNKYDGYVFNSGFKENVLSGVIGLNKSWGYSHLHISIYHLTPGIVEGERDSASGNFLKKVAIDANREGSAIVTDNDLKSYTPTTPYQQINHYKAVINNSFILGNGSLKAVLGFQQNQRQEYADVLNPNKYGLYFLLNTINYDVRYLLPEYNNWNLSIGANGMQQTSLNKGTEYLVPEYDLFDIGGFIIAKKAIGKFDMSGGIRYDFRSEQGKDLYLNSNKEKIDNPETGSTHRFTAFNTQYNAVSGSIGATYQFSDNVFTKFNISRGYRAPSIGEIAANGVHDGTQRYELGDPNLKAENSLQLDYALGLNTQHISAEVDLFSNTIDNFIFSHKLSSTSGGDSITQGYSTFKFVAGTTNLSGGEIIIDIHPHPLDWLHIENSFSYVEALQLNQPDSTKHLPFTPAPKLQTEMRADIKKIGKSLHNVYLKVGVDNYFSQNKFYSAYGTETVTPGYSLINLGIGSEVVHKVKTICSIFISINNLTDVAYQSHLSRLKHEAINYATGRAGVFNMGRNISFKLLIPIGLK